MDSAPRGVQPPSRHVSAVIVSRSRVGSETTPARKPSSCPALESVGAQLKSDDTCDLAAGVSNR